MDGGVPERVAVGRRGGGGRVVQVLVRRTRLRRSVQHQPHHQVVRRTVFRTKVVGGKFKPGALIKMPKILKNKAHAFFAPSPL